ncbi:hypothetical protein BH09CHL1_BH09CHL1_32080 [soil metagenome]
MSKTLNSRSCDDHTQVRLLSELRMIRKVLPADSKEQAARKFAPPAACRSEFVAYENVIVPVIPASA